MITVRFDNPGLNTQYYIVKVSYFTLTEEIVGINLVLETKMSDIQVASVLAANVKDTYKLSITSIPKSKKLPGGYYETFSIDDVLSKISRLKFVETRVVEEPKVVYVKRVITKEL